MFLYVRRKNDFIRKLSLISKFMTSQPAKQTTTIYILPNISRSKGNHTMKLDQLIEYIKRNVFLQKSFKKGDWETSSRLLFVYLKSLIASDLKLTFNPLSANFLKWPNTLKQFVGNLTTKCLSVFCHFVGLALKGLIYLDSSDLDTQQKQTVPNFRL